MGLFQRRKHQEASDDEQTECQRTIAAWSPEERARKEKALVAHIDRRLLPMLVHTTKTEKPLQGIDSLTKKLDTDVYPKLHRPKRTTTR